MVARYKTINPTICPVIREIIYVAKVMPVKAKATRKPTIGSTPACSDRSTTAAHTLTIPRFSWSALLDRLLEGKGDFPASSGV